MAELNASEVVVGANGRVLVASVDDNPTFPDDIATAIDTVFVEVGYVSEDGVTFTDGKEVTGIPAWQSFYDIRKIVTAKSAKVEFVMRQWNPDTVKLAFGGGDVDTSSGDAVYTPSTPGQLDVRALIVEWIDGDATYRLVLPRGEVTGEVSTNVVRTSAADLPISFEITPAGLPESGDLGTQAWYLVTDADAFGS